MRTWRQGVIGRVSAHGRHPLYLRCLTYPLAQIFEHFDPVSLQLSGPLGLIRVRLTGFAKIERVGDSKLTAAERRIDPADAAWADWG